MARNLSVIYNSIKEKCSEHRELDGLANSSKFSVSGAIFYIVASVIYTFEVLLDAFQVELAKDIKQHVNGTGRYYVNMLLQYQKGHVLKMNDEGTQFEYDTIDENARIIKAAVCDQTHIEGYYDNHLVFKIATGDAGNYTQIDDSELESIRNYIDQIAFAGTKFEVVSMKGDIFVPRVLVYYDGAYTEAQVLQNIKQAIYAYVESIAFSGVVFPSMFNKAILGSDGVVNVVDENKYDNVELGYYVASYDKDGKIIETNNNPFGLVRYSDSFIPNSGYLREANKEENKIGYPLWQSSIILKVQR